MLYEYDNAEEYKYCAYNIIISLNMYIQLRFSNKLI